MALLHEPTLRLSAGDPVPLAELPLPRALADLSRRAVSGTLFLQLGPYEKSLALRGGTPVAIESNIAEEALEKYLVQRGELDAQRALEARNEAAVSGRDIGDVLVQMGAFRPDQLFVALKRSLGARILSAFAWDRGVMQLVEDDADPARQIVIKVAPGPLVFRGACSFSPYEVIEADYGDLDARYVVAPAAREATTALRHNTVEGRAINHLSRPHSRGELAAAARIELADATRILYALARLGIATVADADAGRDATTRALGRASDPGFGRPAAVEAAPATSWFGTSLSASGPRPIVSDEAPTMPPRAPLGDAARPTSTSKPPPQASWLGPPTGRPQPVASDEGAARARPSMATPTTRPPAAAPSTQPPAAPAVAAASTVPTRPPAPPAAAPPLRATPPAGAPSLGATPPTGVPSLGATPPTGVPALGANALTAEEADAIDRAYLAARSRDYFELLGVPRDVSFDGLRRAFLDRCDRYSPMSYRGRELGDHRDRLEELFLLLVRAFSTLAVPSSRKEYAAQKGEAPAEPVRRAPAGSRPSPSIVPPAAAARQERRNAFAVDEPRDASASVRTAVMFLNGGQPRDAVATLVESLRERAGDATAAALLGYALYLADPMTRLKDAVKQLERAAELDARCLEAPLLLGRILEFEQDRGRALEAYRAVLRLDAGHREALEAVGRLERRARPSDDGRR